VVGRPCHERETQMRGDWMKDDPNTIQPLPCVNCGATVLRLPNELREPRCSDKLDCIINLLKVKREG